MNTPEIVTLQIGHYSNFVGSHWWNCQESSFIYDPKVAAQTVKEINHDVLYREGRTLKGDVTYTPRLILYDLNNSLGTLKREGILYDVTREDDVRWQGDVTLHQASAADKNPYLLDLEQEYGEDSTVDPDKRKIEAETSEVITYQGDDEKAKPQETSASVKANGPPTNTATNGPFYQLDDKVKVWSDYLGTSLHTKSIHLIQEHQHGNPEQPFDVFGMGERLLSRRESQDALEDSIRFFTEECDHLQGFHILLDSHNAFGGFASPILTYLADEYSNKSRFTFSLTPATPPDQTARERSCRIINSALSLHACMRHSSLHLPLSLASSLWRSVGSPIHFPHLQYQAKLDYHTSGILATALDTMTLPYRSVDGGRMADLVNIFNSGGRKVAALSAGLPLPLTQDTSLTDYLLDLKGHDPWMSLTPHVKGVTSPVFQSCVVRGLPTSRVMCTDPKSQNASSSLSLCSSVDDVFRLYMSESFPRSASASCVMRDPIKLDSSFPHMFKPHISRQGYLSDTARPLYCGVEQIPLMTSLQTGREIGSHVSSLYDSVSRMTISKHQHFLEAGLDSDDFKEACQDLQDLSLCYNT